MLKTLRLGGLALACLAVACRNRGAAMSETAERTEKTEYQEQLIRDGWAEQATSQGELGEDYGYKPAYGLQDNYFDIIMGDGANVAVKIMDTKSGRCIRYALVNMNSSVTLSQIPQGRYYLKLAYGHDWMELDTGSGRIGKFTRSAFYEKSAEEFDFGLKNSQQVINYELRINVRETEGMNNFETLPISEEDFLK